MEQNKSKIDVDPDYKRYNTALRRTEEEREENKLASDKVPKIIAEEFDKELSIRQKQLEEIEDNIYKAQKLLHLVRYVLITSYYNKKHLEHNTTNTDYNVTPGFDTQNRIHPAVKKLLGNNSTLEILNLRGKRRARDKNYKKTSISHSRSPTPKKIKLEPQESLERSFKSQVVSNNQISVKQRKKTRYRIVVGNISKWMPSLENDNTTHKWMVYIRSLKEAVDISQVVEKVKFYLHPSYKPHDVVEVDNSPFHLSRRGWGEFPLRVQIFFTCPLNKPVSIVHNLKLDKTYTGRQTLGNETVVDLYLHGDDFCPEQEPKMENFENMETGLDSINENVRTDFYLSPSVNVSNPQSVLKTEVNENLDRDLNNLPLFDKEENDLSMKIKQETNLEPASTCFEHNYCYEEIIEENIVDLEIPLSRNDNFSRFDHSYCLPYSEYNDLSCSQNLTESEIDVVNQDQNNKLIFGLGESYVESDTRPSDSANSCKEERIDSSIDKSVIKTLTTATGQPIRFLPQSFSKLLLNNGNIIQIQLLRRPQSLLKKVSPTTILQQNLNSQEKLIDYEKYKIALPKNRFKNIGEALPYLFKRLSLWNELANDLDFKCVYPFTATSAMEFFSWNIGKRLSSEWSRAKTVKRILSAEQLPDVKKWNTKTCFMYARSHGYSPLPSLGAIFMKRSVELELLMSCFTNSLPPNKFSLENSVGIDIDVDVTADTETENITPPTVGKTYNIDISDNSLKYHCAFVKEAALDCGVILKSEEIAEGITMNGAERMIFEAIKCFAEGLIRRSRHHLVCEEGFSEETSKITTEEIKIALNERPEMKSIFTFQKRKRNKEFFL